MSAVEFGLRSQAPLLNTLSPLAFENPLTTRLRLLADISTSLAGNAKLEPFLTMLTLKIRRVMVSDFAILGLSHFNDVQFQVKAFDATDDIELNRDSVDSLGKVLWE